MEINSAVIEYYDELHSISEEQKRFYDTKIKEFKNPAKLLSICCGAGTFEHFLAQDGFDVTGIETIPALLEAAARRRRTQIMSLRFFKMSALEMTRFLGKGFYNIISILNWRIIFTCDATLLEKLFFDCKHLLSENGILVLTFPNFKKFFDESEFCLPQKNSMRASLRTKIKSRNGEFYFFQELENSSGKKISVVENEPVSLVQKDFIEKLAEKAGFSSVEFFDGFSLNAADDCCDEICAVIR